MSPATSFVQNPGPSPKVIAYQRSKFFVLDKIFQDQKIKKSNFYSFIGKNQMNLHLPAGVTCFDYIKILEEFKVVDLSEEGYYSLTQKGINDYFEVKAEIGE